MGASRHRHKWKPLSSDPLSSDACTCGAERTVLGKVYEPAHTVGGSLEPVGSEILGEILIREYNLTHLEHDLKQCLRRVEAHREWLRKLTAQLSPNAPARRPPITPL